MHDNNWKQSVQPLEMGIVFLKQPIFQKEHICFGKGCCSKKRGQGQTYWIVKKNEKINVS